MTTARNDRGYVLAMTALLLIPLMLFAAFAVDVGAWFVKGQQAQRASDAAALAGVVWMPNFSQAEAAAVDAARRNGFEEPGGFASGIQPNLPQIEVVSVGAQQLQVTIHTSEQSFFGQVALDEVEIDRRATAEYNLPVPLGNPTNSLGTADLDLGGASPPAGFYLNTHATGLSVTAGDLLNSGNSPLYSPVGPGFVYVVTKPIGTTVDLTIEVFHGGRCKRNGSWAQTGWGNGRGENHGSDTPELDMVLYPADSTRLDDSDNLLLPPIPAVDGSTVYSPDASECPVYNDGGTDPNLSGTVIDANWQPAFTIPGAAPSGRYYLTVRSPAGSSGHKNMHGLRVRSSTGPAFCSTIGSTTCPSINALERMSVYIGENTRIPAAGPSQADFYFAEISEVHAGKEMELQIWDAAEGSEFMQILDPFGNPVPFKWETINRSTSYAWPSSFGTAPDLAGSGETLVTTCPLSGALVNSVTNDSPCLDVSTGNPFASRMLRLRVDLTGYTCNGNNCWWRIYYKSTSAVDDTTTWSVKIIGDPVRLVD